MIGRQAQQIATPSYRRIDNFQRTGLPKLSRLSWLSDEVHWIKGWDTERPTIPCTLALTTARTLT